MPTSHPRIHILPPLLANQIAAGEVIERPASVIKELVENAIDAGADEIEIIIDKGGLKRIIVADNGSGIYVDDLVLALKRHGTSKILNEKDLIGIESLGFRGEALASIAAVSKVTLASRYKDSSMAYQISCYGDVISEEPVPCNILNGTRICVEDLFFNVPARRAFLRSEKTEFQHISSIVNRLALSHFKIGFTLIHNDKQIWKLPRALSKTAEEIRVQKLFSKNFIEYACKIIIDHPPLKLWGWLTHYAAEKSFANAQQIYVNSRMVRDKTLLHAIKQAYQLVSSTNQITPGFLLYLELDPDKVDVNVHPTKHEVRFHDQRLIHDFIVTAVKRTFEEEPFVLENKKELSLTDRKPQKSAFQNENIQNERAYFKMASEQTSPAYRKSDNSREKNTIEKSYFHCHSNNQKNNYDKVSENKASYNFIFENQHGNTNENQEKLDFYEEERLKPEIFNKNNSYINDFNFIKNDNFFIFNSFVFYFDIDNITILDVEKFIKIFILEKLSSITIKKNSLLFPAILKVENNNINLSRILENLQDLGFVLSAFSDKSFRLEEAPDVFHQLPVIHILEEIIRKYDERLPMIENIANITSQMLIENSDNFNIISSFLEQAQRLNISLRQCIRVVKKEEIKDFF